MKCGHLHTGGYLDSELMELPLWDFYGGTRVECNVYQVLLELLCRVCLLRNCDSEDRD